MNKGSYLKPVILALSALGIILSLYLTYLHFTESQAAFCAAGSDCDTVRQSGFSTIMGIPVAAVGVAGYSVILIVFLIRHEETDEVAPSLHTRPGRLRIFRVPHVHRALRYQSDLHVLHLFSGPDDDYFYCPAQGQIRIPPQTVRVLYRGLEPGRRRYRHTRRGACTG